MEGSTGDRHPLDCVVGRATGLRALCSTRQELAAGCVLKVPGCWTLGLFLAEYVGTWHITGAAGYIVAGVACGDDGCTGDAAALGAGVAPVIVILVSALRPLTTPIVHSLFPCLKHGAVGIVCGELQIKKG